MQIDQFKKLLELLLKNLSAELCKEFALATLDFIEQKVKQSETKVDDFWVLPICDNIRKIFNLPSE